MEEFDHDCSICMQVIDDADTSHALPCGHRFHGACLAPWLWAHRSCPNCRCSPEEPEERITSLDSILESIRNQARMRSVNLQRGLRRARTSGAPAALRRYSEAYRRWKLKATETRKALREAETDARKRQKGLRDRLRVVYAQYLYEYNRERRLFKEQNRPAQAALSKLKSTLRRQRSSIRWYENLIVAGGEAEADAS